MDDILGTSLDDWMRHLRIYPFQRMLRQLEFGRVIRKCRKQITTTMAMISMAEAGDRTATL